MKALVYHGPGQPLAETEEAYDGFADATETKALKVVLEGTPVGHDLLMREEAAVGG